MVLPKNDEEQEEKQGVHNLNRFEVIPGGKGVEPPVDWLTERKLGEVFLCQVNSADLTSYVLFEYHVLFKTEGETKLFCPQPQPMHFWVRNARFSSQNKFIRTLGFILEEGQENATTEPTADTEQRDRPDPAGRLESPEVGQGGPEDHEEAKPV